MKSVIALFILSLCLTSAYACFEEPLLIVADQHKISAQLPFEHPYSQISLSLYNESQLVDRRITDNDSISFSDLADGIYTLEAQIIYPYCNNIQTQNISLESSSTVIYESPSVHLADYALVLFLALVTGLCLVLILRR